METSPTLPPELVLVLTTAPDVLTGERIARALVSEGLAACVNLLPNVVSIYRWQGSLEQAQEVLLIAKSHRSRWHEFEARLHELHPYAVPECVALEALQVSRAYGQWVEALCRLPQN